MLEPSQILLQGTKNTRLQFARKPSRSKDSQSLPKQNVSKSHLKKKRALGSCRWRSAGRRCINHGAVRRQRKGELGSAVRAGFGVRTGGGFGLSLRSRGQGVRDKDVWEALPLPDPPPLTSRLKRVRKTLWTGKGPARYKARIGGKSLISSF